MSLLKIHTPISEETSTTSVKCWLCSVLLLCFLTGFISPESKAQGTAQVLISGFPPVLESPFLSDIERNYQQGSYTTQFVFISPSRQPRSFQFKLTLEHDGELLIDMTSQSASFEPGIHTFNTFDEGSGIIFPLAYDQWLSQLGPDISNTGILSEGNYALRIEAVPEDTDALIPSIPGVAIFNVQYAEPPLLLAPFDEAEISSQLPIFSWTPVTGVPFGTSIEYELFIVEIYPEQAPYQAIESNIEHVREVLIDETSFVYTLNELPLEPGKKYAWQVRARDANRTLPILDQGETEYRTFSVQSDGLGAVLTSWNYPLNSPFLRYNFEESFNVDEGQTELFIDERLPVEIMGVDASATFDNLLIDVETQHIIEGSITLDTPIALEIAINPLNDTFNDYDAVSPGSDLTLRDGLLLELGSNVLINADGLHPTGTHRALVSYSGYGKEEWTATFSEDFVIALTPFNVVSGRVDFATDGIAKGYADITGFHLIDQNDPVIAQLPDRLLLPDPSMGFIPLKRDGQALVILEEGVNQFKISSRPNANLELVLSGLQGTYTTQPPRFITTFEDITIDAATGLMIAGSLTASIDSDDRSYVLDQAGIPLAASSVTIEKDSASTTFLLHGVPTIFGQPVQNSDETSISISQKGVASGFFAMNSEDAYIMPDASNQNLRIDIESLTGFIEATIGSPRSRKMHMDVSGQLSLLASDGLAARSDVAFAYSGEGEVHISDLKPQQLQTETPYIKSSSEFYIHEIESVSMYYSAKQGLAYTAPLKTSLQIGLNTGPLLVNIEHAELNNHGLFIPEQELHEGTPGFTPYSFEHEGNQLDLLAARIPAARIAHGDSLSSVLLPRFDFGIHISDLITPEDIHIPGSLTIQNATVQQGVIEGKILPFKFLSNPLSWHLRSGIYSIDAISGNLMSDSGKQSIILNLTGRFAPEVFSISGNCEIRDLNIRLIQHQAAQGSSLPFTPCEPVHVPPFDVNYTDAVLQIDIQDTSEVVVLKGNVVSFGGQASISSLSGLLSYDISHNSINEANLEIEELQWSFPTLSPLFDIHITDAILTHEGFSFSSDSSFSASTLKGSTELRLDPERNFKLGWHPAVSNSGRSNLIAVNGINPLPGSYFDEKGFHLDIADRSLPGKITLPALDQVHLVLPEEDRSFIDLKEEKEGLRLLSKNDDSAFIELSLFGTNDKNPVLPVEIDLKTTDTFFITGGTFKGDYSDSPVDLSEWGYPVILTSIDYNSERPAGQRVYLTGELTAPPSLTNADETLSFEGSLNTSGLTGKIAQAENLPIYPGSLDASLYRITLNSNTSGKAKIEIKGELEVPDFSSESGIPFISTYKPELEDWQFALRDISSQEFQLDKGALFKVPYSGISLDQTPEFNLELEGKLFFTPIAGPAFWIGTTVEINPGGLQFLVNDTFESPRHLFGGFLEANLDAVDLEYQSENRILIATIDGSFLPSLEVSDNTSNRIPFSGFQLSSSGSIAFSGNLSPSSPDEANQKQTMELLSGLAPIEVLEDAFVITALDVSNDSLGLTLNLGGSVKLPSPGTTATRSINQNELLPVSITIDRTGAILQNQSRWTFSSNDGAENTSISQSGLFKYSNASLQFNPLLPFDTHLLASGNLTISLPPSFIVSAGERIPITQDSTLNLRAQSISLGNDWDSRFHPGIIIKNQQPVHYLTTDTPSFDNPLFTIESDITEFSATTTSLPYSDRFLFNLGGYSKLQADGFDGFFPVEGVTIDHNGILDNGSSAGASLISFRNLATFEVGCFDYNDSTLSAFKTASALRGTSPPSNRAGIEPINGPYNARLRFGKVCGTELPLTLTDKWFAGTYDNFSILKDDVSIPSIQIEGAQIELSHLASLSLTLAYNNSSTYPFLEIDGNALYRGASFTGTGSLKEVNGLPGLSLLFNPKSQKLDIVPGHVRAQVPGGGIFYRPTSAELDLVELVLNERSNNSFSSNLPGAKQATGIPRDSRLSLLLPVEVEINPQGDQTDFLGIGLLKESEQFAYLDLDGHFLDEEEQLKSNLFLLQNQDATSPEAPSLEGLARISLNYSAVAGGVVSTNFNLSPGSEVPLSGRQQGVPNS